MYCIAIDGGGTKTDIVLFEETGKIVKRAITSASCPTSIGMDASFETVACTIKKLLADTGLTENSIASVYAGIAGCGIQSIGDLYTNRIESLFSKSTIVKVGSDIINVLNCGVSINDGMALICGTGSSLLVRNRNELHQVGGWGYLLGDEGSGYDIGKRGLMAALMAFDGRETETILSKLIELKLGAPVQQCVGKLYEGGKSLIASFAPEVFEAALLNDKVALHIIELAANSLRDMLIAGSHYLKSAEYTVVLAGGIWKAGNGMLEKKVSENLQDNFKMVCPNIPPVYGAAVQAMNNINIKIESTFETTIQYSLNLEGEN